MEAVADIENIISIEGIDYIHIGLNDIHLQRGRILFSNFFRMDSWIRFQKQ